MDGHRHISTSRAALWMASVILLPKAGVFGPLLGGWVPTARRWLAKLCAWPSCLHQHAIWVRRDLTWLHPATRSVSDHGGCGAWWLAGRGLWGWLYALALCKIIPPSLALTCEKRPERAGTDFW